jgi:hypothetical protein
MVFVGFVLFEEFVNRSAHAAASLELKRQIMFLHVAKASPGW